MRTTEENNRLIAEFMGYKMINNLQISTPNGGGVFLSELRYRTSWNELMPVVEKIDKLVLNFKLTPSNIKGDNLAEDIFSSLREVSIRLTYSRAVQFIEWYNENK
jgi:hypothetical protein